jgi:hypothetical protein
MDSYAPN